MAVIATDVSLQTCDDTMTVTCTYVSLLTLWRCNGSDSHRYFTADLWRCNDSDRHVSLQTCEHAKAVTATEVQGRLMKMQSQWQPWLFHCSPWRSNDSNSNRCFTADMGRYSGSDSDRYVSLHTLWMCDSESGSGSCEYLSCTIVICKRRESY